MKSRLKIVSLGSRIHGCCRSEQILWQGFEGLTRVDFTNNLLWRFAFVYTNHSEIPFVCLQWGIFLVIGIASPCVHGRDKRLSSRPFVSHYDISQDIRACFQGLFSQVVNKTLICMQFARSFKKCTFTIMPSLLAD